MTVQDTAKRAKEAAVRLSSLSTELKNRCLMEMADTLRNRAEEILKESAEDVRKAEISVEKGKLGPPLLKRLKLDASKLDQMILSIESVAAMKDPVGEVLGKTLLDDGLVLSRVACPIGVIGVIFESRPDAVTQIGSLCFKSGNSVILKGGSEAGRSIRILVESMNEALSKFPEVPVGVFNMVETREDVSAMLDLDRLIDLLIPRGSNELVRYIQSHTKIPVLGHSDGICNVYVDIDVDLPSATELVVDSKCQYPGVCNAAENLLVHREIAGEVLPLVRKELEENGVLLKGCEETQKILQGISPATDKDWDTEYLDLILSIKVVADLTEAIDFINLHGSGHTDAILTKDQGSARQFFSGVDSSSVLHNCSTRFADGFRYGLGAEVGISTNKTHARGPVGLEGLVIYQYRLEGSGQTVAQYSGKGGKKFKHKPLAE